MHCLNWPCVSCRSFSPQWCELSSPSRAVCAVAGHSHTGTTCCGAEGGPEFCLASVLLATRSQNGAAEVPDGVAGGRCPWARINRRAASHSACRARRSSTASSREMNFALSHRLIWSCVVLRLTCASCSVRIRLCVAKGLFSCTGPPARACCGSQSMPGSGPLPFMVTHASQSFRAGRR
jgi:hypothetical protein